MMQSIAALLLYTLTVPIVQASSFNPNVLDGIFLSLDSSNDMFTVDQWRNEFQAMKDVGIKFFIVRSIFNGVEGNATGCPLGPFQVYYNTTLQPARCYTRRGVTSTGGAVGLILAAARDVGLDVHLGLALPNSGFRSPKQYGNKTLYFETLYSLQFSIASEVWNTFGGNDSGIVGIYTGLEENNLPGWLTLKDDLTDHYLQPLSRAVKQKLRSDIVVWASPYAVLNIQSHGFQHPVSAGEYAEFWGEVFQNAPDFDFVANQDSMGWQGNSFQNVSDILAALQKSSTAAGRATWSNVELFEGWPQPCEYPTPCGRAPAPFERVKSQLENERQYASVLIAWEWHSCLSPYSNNKTLEMYTRYSDYAKN